MALTGKVSNHPFQFFTIRLFGKLAADKRNY